MEKNYYIYILTNKNNTVLYTAVNDLKRRVYVHKEKINKSFTQKYNVDKLDYYEVFDTSESEILREKQIKGGSRKNKLFLIQNFNK